MTTRIKSMRLMAVAAFVVVVCMLASAQAQTPASKLTDNGFSNPSEFRLNFFGLPTRKRSFSLRPAGFRLIAEPSAGINASAITPLASGLNLQVFGSGTLGRLTKWTGFTSSNSSIGDSGIFEANGCRDDSGDRDDSGERGLFGDARLDAERQRHDHVAAWGDNSSRLGGIITRFSGRRRCSKPRPTGHWRGGYRRRHRRLHRQWRHWR